MLAKENGINFFQQTVERIKEIKIPKNLKETKMVTTHEGEKAFQLDNGLLVITRVAKKPITQWNERTVEYVSLCLKALSSADTQFETEDEKHVIFPIQDIWLGRGSMEESESGQKIFRLYTIEL